MRINGLKQNRIPKEFVMKKKLIIVLAIFTACILSGCVPPNYTEDHAEECLKAHYSEAVDWFSEKMPEAKVSEEAKCYSSHPDLYQLIEGQYEKDGKKYTFLYDYGNNKMYTSENYKKVCDTLKDMVVERCNLDVKKTNIEYEGTTIITHTDNDDLRDAEIDPYAEKELSWQKVVDTDYSTEDFVEAISKGDIGFSMYIYVYDDFIPEYDKSIFDDFAFLSIMFYHKPISFEKEYSDMYMAKYDEDGAEESYIHIKEVDDGIYAGYHYTNAGDNTINDKLIIKSSDKNCFDMEIPEGTKPILFTEDKEVIEQYIDQHDSEELEGFDLYHECPGNSEYKIILNDYVVENDINYLYEDGFSYTDDGLYSFKY